MFSTRAQMEEFIANAPKEAVKAYFESLLTEMNSNVTKGFISSILSKPRNEVHWCQPPQVPHRPRLQILTLEELNPNMALIKKTFPHLEVEAINCRQWCKVSDGQYSMWGKLDPAAVPRVRSGEIQPGMIIEVKAYILTEEDLSTTNMMISAKHLVIDVGFGGGMKDIPCTLGDPVDLYNSMHDDPLVFRLEPVQVPHQIFEFINQGAIRDMKRQKKGSVVEPRLLILEVTSVKEIAGDTWEIVLFDTKDHVKASVKAGKDISEGGYQIDYSGMSYMKRAEERERVPKEKDVIKVDRYKVLGVDELGVDLLKASVLYRPDGNENDTSASFGDMQSGILSIQLFISLSGTPLHFGLKEKTTGRAGNYLRERNPLEDLAIQQARQQLLLKDLGIC